ncbi:MAG: hypothetical protein JW941_07780, partial [Candidatus Coatesbacteria bacterium]|nr:hypothetical protein [Candidatus Coatesbacteria bacterium]
MRILAALACVCALAILFVEELRAQEPPIELSIKTQKDYYRPGDEFRVNIECWNPGGACIANLYIWINGPDSKSYYMPDWGELKHPWISNIVIEAGFSFGPSTVLERTLPDFHMPVWQAGDYQLCAELVESATGDPLGPFAMTQFGLHRGVIDILYDSTNWILDVEARGNEIWTAGTGGVSRWWKENDQWEHERYNRFDGLSDTYMRAMYEDQSQILLIWPYVGFGLTVYDGYNFKNLFKDRTLGIDGMVTDRDLNMWAAAELGIFKITRNGELSIADGADGLPAPYRGIRIALGPDGYPAAVVEAARPQALHLCRYNGQSWDTIPFPFDWIDEDGEEMMQYIRCMVIDLQGHVWFGTLYGALEYDGSDTIRHSMENSGIAGNNVYKMKLDSMGRIWFACPSPVPGYGGLCFYDGASWGLVPGIDQPDVTGLAVTFDGTLAVGRTDGLIIAEPGSLPSIHRTTNPDIDSASGELAWSPDGVLCIADKGRGLWIYRDGIWQLIASENGLASNSATSVAFDSEGTCWIGSNSGLTRWEGNEFTVFKMEDGMATDSVLSLAIDAYDHPWVIGGGYKQVGDRVLPDYRLSHYDGTTWYIHTPEEGSPSIPIQVFTDKRGWVWVIGMGLAGYTLQSYDGQQWRVWGPDDGFFEMDMCDPWILFDSENKAYITGYIKISDTERKSLLAIFDGTTWTQTDIDYSVSRGAFDS